MSTSPTMPATSGNLITRVYERINSSSFLRNFSSMGLAQISIRASRLLATILLSRLLLPQDYGLAAIVLTAYEFVALFTRNGISAKVIQAKDEDVEVVAMTAYRMTWIVCLGLMAVQVLVAWPFAWFYGDERLGWPIAAMALVYLATPVSNIQGAFQVRECRMGRIAVSGAAQVIIDNMLTAVLALAGFGMWAIILPKILVAPIWAIPVRLGHAWRPHAIEGVSRYQGWQDIARFSRSVMGVELLSTLQSNMDNLIVGYFLGLQALGLYYFAFNAGLGLSLGFVTAIAAAAFPHMCNVRHDPAALVQRCNRSMKLALITIVPIILLQAGLASVYVPIIFGDKWDAAIPVLSMICLSALVRPFSAITSQALRALGRPEIEFKFQLINTIVLGGALLLSAQFNIYWVGAAVLVVQTIMLATYTWFVRKTLTRMALDAPMPNAAKS